MSFLAIPLLTIIFTFIRGEFHVRKKRLKKRLIETVKSRHFHYYRSSEVRELYELHELREWLNVIDNAYSIKPTLIN